MPLQNAHGAVETIDIGLTLPTRSVSHVARLIELKLEALAATCDAGFGFEAIGLAVTCAEPMPARQTELMSVTDEGDRTERCASLIDCVARTSWTIQRAALRTGGQSLARTRRSAAAARRRGNRVA